MAQYLEGCWFDSLAPPGYMSVLGQSTELQITPDEQVGTWYGSLCCQCMNLRVNGF